VASRAFHWNFDTLCLVANDVEGMRRAVDALLAPPPAVARTPDSQYGPAEKIEGRDALSLPSALSFLGNNEYVLDMKFDKAGNIYLITWGHGDNLYSLDPAGRLRFSRRLPEMGASRLNVGSDRVIVFTAYGSRLYQLSLDGKPMSQAQLTMDPGLNERSTTYRERFTPDLLRHGLASPEMGMDFYTALMRYDYLPGTQRFVYHDFLTESMRMLDGELRPVAEWQGESRYGDDGRAIPRRLGAFVCSPDGNRIAQIEGNALVLRDLNDGKVRKLCERPVFTKEGRLTWQPGEPGPTLQRTHYGADLAPLWQEPAVAEDAPFQMELGALGVLAPDGASALRLLRASATGVVEVARFESFRHQPTFVQASPDGRYVVFLDEYWTAFVHEVATGRRIGEARLSEMGFAVTFTPDSQKFLVGGLRGAVMCHALDGTRQWSTLLGPFNQSLAQTNWPRVDAAYADRTTEIFRPLVDQPGELDALVTLDRSRLVNGECETGGGWQVDTNEAAGAEVVYADVGHQGKRSLKVGAVPVQQQIEGMIGEHFTWVLEFYHRSASPDKPARLLAGLDVQNRHPDQVVRTLASGREWQYDRVVFKSGGDPRSLCVGFQAQNGEVLVDGVTLRRIRFPSVNHMLHPPVYDVEPVILRNPLFQRDYDPLGGTLREQIPNIILAQRTEQIANALLTDSFLQNGRLNDVCSEWYNAPLGTVDTKVALGLRVPRWISMVALYFNAYDEENTTRHWDIYVSDVSLRKNVRVASVRNNRSLFRLVKFPPRRVDQVQVVLVNCVPGRQTLTEAEIYGPMSGSEQIGFVDSEGQNTYMGSFARVDRRTLTMAPMYETKTVTAPAAVTDKDRTLPRWAVPVSQVLMGEGNVYLSRAYGYNERVALPDVGGTPATVSRTGGMGFGPTATMYGGALLKPGSDGKLYCIDPDSGRSFWAVPLGDRLTGAPVVIGLDIYVATDTGVLYILDLASGAILGQSKLAGAVQGSLATDNQNLYAVTAGGRLQALAAAGGREVWSVPIAPFSDSTPAVDGGVVYLADQRGTARAVRSSDGQVLWTRELGSEFCRCPVVFPEQVVFGCSDGRLTALNRKTGDVLWQNQQKTKFIKYDPVALQLGGGTNAGPVQSALLCMSGANPQLLDPATGNPSARQIVMGSIKNGKLVAAGDPPSVGDLMAPISFYNGSLVFVTVPHESRVTGPIYNDTAYDWFMYASSWMLKGLNEPESKEAQEARKVRPVARLEAPVQVDGLLDDWGMPTNTLSGPEAIFPVAARNKDGSADKSDRRGRKSWIGFDDLGAKLYLATDDKDLYLAVKATDDVHVNNRPSSSIVTGDCVQISFATPAGVQTLALALLESGPAIQQVEGGRDGKLAASTPFAVVRSEEDQQFKTTYELRVPLAELGLRPGMDFGMNVAVLDDDEGGRAGVGPLYWLQLGPGMALREAKPDATRYPRFVLPKPAEAR
jgi:outer membrane protein assembly factor BamB